MVLSINKSTFPEPLTNVVAVIWFAFVMLLPLISIAVDALLPVVNTDDNDGADDDGSVVHCGATVVTCDVNTCPGFPFG